MPNVSIRSPRLVAVGLLAGSVALGALATGLAPTGATAQTGVPAVQVGSFADLVEATSPAVVAVRVERTRSADGPMAQRLPPGMEDFMRRFGLPPEAMPGAPGGPRGGDETVRGIGSGFFIGPDGYLVTNNHVVEDADRVTIVRDDGTEHEAEIVGTDEKTDLALLKVEGEDFPYLQFGESDTVRPGDWVIAIGSPFGLGGSVTAGIVSARGRDLNAGPYDDFLQLDAPINRGNSGGPSLDAEGRVIGVNTAIFSPSGGSVGIGFAIPAALAQDVIADLRDDGRVDRGWLGVSIQPVTEDMASALGLDEASGALVADVMPDSPALAAGIESGDVIVSWNGTEIAEVGDLTRAVAATEQGSEADVTLWRGGTQRDFSVTVGLLPEDDRMASAPVEKPQMSALPGVEVMPLTPETRRQLGLDDSVTGVAVADVAANGPTDLRPGDVILRAGDRAIESPDDLAAALAAADREAVLLQVMRDGRTLFVAAPVSLG